MHVAITGASSGIGEAIARAFARVGAELTLVARRKERLDALAAEVGVRCHVVAADLSDPKKAADWIAPAIAALGPIDVLVNNAGIQIVAKTHTVDPDRADQLLRLNVLTPLRLARAVLPAMIERGSGTIVDIASLAAIAPTPYMYWYNASKGALAAASESLRGELRGTGVHVLTVYPGPIKTAMADQAMDAYGEEHAGKIRNMPTGTTERLAQLIRRGVDKRHHRIIYPRVYAVARWFPGTTRWIMDRFSPAPASSAD